MKLIIERMRALPAIAALSLFVAGCAGTAALQQQVDNAIGQGDYRRAVAAIRNNTDLYGSKNSVLYNLDVGLLYHYLGEPDSSNKFLLQAEREIEDLFTKSVSGQILSFVVNDNLLAYEGEDHEKVLVNVFLALNFAEKRDIDAALVEARKVDLKLREYTRQYDGKNTYKEDAFIRYLTGVLYETAGEVNDAFIAYRNAYHTYKAYESTYGITAPGFLLDDIVRTATQMNFEEERLEFEKLGGKPYDRRRRNDGSVLVVTYVGKGPQKSQIRPSVSIADTAGIIHTFQIALPKFEPRYSGGREYEVMLASGRDTIVSTADVAYNITAIAGKALDDRITNIYLKSGGRAVLKFLAAEKAKSDLKKNQNTLVNILGSIAIDAIVAATEQADTRAWRILPAQIHLSRIHLPVGSYVCAVSANDGNFSLRDVPVEVKPGKTSIVIVDDVR